MTAKFASHLERCTGKGGRASSRLARNRPSAAAAAAAVTAAQSQPPPPPPPQPPQSSNTAAALDMARWDDDAEVMAASKGSNSGNGKYSTSASPVNAHRRTHSQSAQPSSPAHSISPYPHSATPVQSSSYVNHAPGSGSGSIRQHSRRAPPPPLHPFQPTDLSSSASPLQSPSMDASSAYSSNGWTPQDEDDASIQTTTPTASASSAGHKRKGDDSSSKSGPDRKRRVILKVEDMWTAIHGPFPTILPIHANEGGVPFLIPTSAPEASMGLEPTPMQLDELLSRICGAPSANTSKMCVNTSACSMHQEEDKTRCRQMLRDGQAVVRYKRVKPGQPKKRTQSTA